MLNDPGVIFSNDPAALVSDPVVEAEFNTFVTAAGLEGARGQILSRNFRKTGSNSRINLRISQEIGLFEIPAVGESKLLLFLDIENLGNLLNDDWGRFEQVRFAYSNVAVDNVSLNANDQYVYSSFDNFTDSLDPAEFTALASVYKIQLGFTFKF